MPCPHYGVGWRLAEGANIATADRIWREIALAALFGDPKQNAAGKSRRVFAFRYRD